MNRGPTRQLLLVLLLLLVGAGTLGAIAKLSEPCGDGLCARGEACALDCAQAVADAPRPLAVAAAPRLEAVAPDPAPPPPATPPEPAAAPPVAAPAPDPAPEPAPDLEPDLGRCAEPRFREVARSVVASCEHACKKDTSPLVALTPSELEALFARPDDAGVQTHFALFGCNRYTTDGRACRGFDAMSAEPSTCPAGNADCARYAGALERELRAFLDRNRDAHTLLLFGTASTTGNHDGAMSEANAKLAEERALAVAEVVHTWRREVGGKARDLRLFPVVLDNTRADWWRSTAFRAALAGQTAKLGTPAAERGFDPLAPDAANRSVLVVAIRCPLDATSVSP